MPNPIRPSTLTLEPAGPSAADSPRSSQGLPRIEVLQQWAHDLGFESIGVAHLDVSEAEPGLRAWLHAGYHGSMDYMARHADLRVHPERLVPGALSALMVTANYAPADPDWIEQAWTTLETSDRAYVARYALGRDYHKVVRGRLSRLADRIAQVIGPFGHRVFCDSAPVMEVELARRAGLGWRGKNTLLIDRQRGSTLFIGTIYTDVPFPENGIGPDHCGRCERCIVACPTGAIVAPSRLDARRCIAYLTIESKASIPLALRPAMGNRVFGCDDCQLACPWNRFAQTPVIADFAPRQGFDTANLVELFSWDLGTFERRTEGSAIRRIGHERWLRNIAVALGNVPPEAGRSAIELALEALATRAEHPSPLVREHVSWARDELEARLASTWQTGDAQPDGQGDR
jgi:epoxyqueuosine reductase